MYDIERCSWFSGSRITAQNANFNTHPNVIPLQYFVIMFMQFYLLFFFISNERLSVIYQGFRTLTHTLTDGSETFWYVCHIKTHVYIYMNYLSVYLWWCTVWLYVHVDIDRSLNKYGIVCHCNQFSLILSLLLKVKSYALMNGLKAECCMLKTFSKKTEA